MANGPRSRQGGGRVHVARIGHRDHDYLGTAGHCGFATACASGRCRTGRHEHGVGVLRSAIGIKVAESIVRQDIGGLPSLAGSNPMDRLAELPSNYLGEKDGVDPATLEDGNWYFDTGSGTLVYLVRNKGYFTGGLQNPPRARFAIRIVYTDRNGNGVFDVGVEAIEGLRLAVLEPYAWTR